ncbi:MAG: hypothetical protein IPG63_17025 [Xanthomonadales bacterium]|nr:hypothetical protein [Xanthomonadales bacterium]MBK7146087.1 hypothetical protein [Xanthomonadales bacterium]
MHPRRGDEFAAVASRCRADASTGEPGFIVFAGGVLNDEHNNTVQSHEMGHFAAALCDEYSTFGGFHWLTGSTT